jgi:A/G-specific adenine glycosylase
VSKHYLSQKIINWQEEFGRNHLPWQKNRSVYTTLVSELMLQQTQVTTMQPYYQNFIDHWPSIDSLKKASLDQVMQAWSGLGYYRRAQYLKKTVDHLPDDQTQQNFNIQDWMKFPGIGQSTAGAIGSLALKKPWPILDGNVKRVFSRLFKLQHPINSTLGLKLLWNIAADCVPTLQPDRYNQGLMDLGSMICTPINPKCKQCPCNDLCLAFQDNTVQCYPILVKKNKSIPIKKWDLVLLTEEKKIFLEKRSKKTLWGNLYCPLILQESQTKDYLSTINLNSASKIQKFKHLFTHFKLEANVYVIAVKNKQSLKLPTGKWVSNWQELALPKPIKDCIENIFSS